MNEIPISHCAMNEIPIRHTDFWEAFHDVIGMFYKLWNAYVYRLFFSNRLKVNNLRKIFYEFAISFLIPYRYKTKR